MISGVKLGWLTNSYLLHHTNAISVTSIFHAYISCLQPLVGYIMAWYSLFAICELLAHFLWKLSIFHMCVSWDDAYKWDYIKSCLWFTHPKYANLANLVAYHSLKVLSCAILICLQTLLSLWYLLPLSKHPNYLVFPCDSCDVFDVVCLKSFNVP